MNHAWTWMNGVGTWVMNRWMTSTSRCWHESKPCVNHATSGDIWCGMISDVVWCGWCVGGLNLGHVRCLWCLPVVLICSDLHIFASLALDSSSLLPRELKDCRWRYRQKSANLDAQPTVQLTMNMIKHGTQNNSTNHCATSHKNHWGNRLLKHLPKANSLQRMESAWNLPPGNAWGDRTPAGFLVVSPTRAVTRCH